MKKLITALLAGILSFGTITGSNAQNQPSAAVTGAVAGGGAYYYLNPESHAIIQEKQGIDYLVDVDVTSVIYAQINNLLTVQINTSNADDTADKGSIIINSSVAGTLNRLETRDLEGQYLIGFNSDSPQLAYSIKGRLPSNYQSLITQNQISFRGTIANKPISFTVNKNGELPVDARGEWNGYAIYVAYTPSTDVKWLVDHAEISLTSLQTSQVVAKYIIKYEFGERKVINGTAIGYKGFTVTKL